MSDTLRSTTDTARARFGSRTDVGRVRDHNEDSLIVRPPLFVISDGMGGHAAGEVASEIAVQVIAERAPAHADADALAQAVEEANLAVIRGAHEGVGREGMGCTVTAAMLEGERLVIAQVGDSRAYLFHQGTLQQITRDHSLMADMIESGQITPEEARYHPNRSIITRALGSDPYMVADTYKLDVEAGDRLMLCSDGLSGMLEDDEMATLLAQTRDPQQCANKLTDAALDAGGHDNVTVIVADVEGFAERTAKKASRKARMTIIVSLLVALVLIAGALGAFKHWIDQSVYLGESEGMVALYRGTPDTLFGQSFSELESVSDIRVDDLAPNTAARLREEGIKADSLEAAEALIDDYRADVARSDANATSGAESSSTSDAAAAPSAGAAE